MKKHPLTYVFRLLVGIVFLKYSMEVFTTTTFYLHDHELQIKAVTGDVGYVLWCLPLISAEFILLVGYFAVRGTEI